MKLDAILTKAFKFIIFVLFMFMTLVYFGVLLVIPLDLMAQIIKLFHAIGLPTVLAAAIGIGALGYFGLLVSKMPQLYQLLLDIGLQLYAFGNDQIKRFDPLVETTSARADA